MGSRLGKLRPEEAVNGVRTKSVAAQTRVRQRRRLPDNFWLVPLRTLEMSCDGLGMLCTHAILSCPTPRQARRMALLFKQFGCYSICS